MTILDAFHFDLSQAYALADGEEEERGKEEGGKEGEKEEGGKEVEREEAEEEERGGGREGEREEGNDKEGQHTGETSEVEGEETMEPELDLEEEDEGEGDERIEATGEAQRGSQKSTAQRVHRTIVHSILPSLQAVLTQKVLPRLHFTLRPSLYTPSPPTGL